MEVGRVVHPLIPGDLFLRELCCVRSRHRFEAPNTPSAATLTDRRACMAVEAERAWEPPWVVPRSGSATKDLLRLLR